MPVYNESQGIEEFHALLTSSLSKLSSSYLYEIVYVDDGSTDNSVSTLFSIANKDSRTRIASLSRNSGKEIALTAGVATANGDAIIMLDADGQHPPNLIPKFITQWESGFDVVVGVRKNNKNEGWVKKNGSTIFYAIFNRLSGTSLVPGSTDYRLISSEVANEFLQIKHHQRITRGLIDWLGYSQSIVYFDAPARLAGEAGYSTKKLFALAGNSFVSLSFMPLRLILLLGIAVSTLASLTTIFLIIEQFVFSDPFELNVSGTAFLALLLLFITGITLITQGIMSIYIAHMYYNAGNRPLYSISSKKSLRL